VSDERRRSAFPPVGIDNAAAAELTATHRQQKGFRNVGYCGDPHFVWSQQCASLFRRNARSAGLKCRVFAAGKPGKSPVGPLSMKYILHPKLEPLLAALFGEEPVATLEDPIPQIERLPPP